MSIPIFIVEIAGLSKWGNKNPQTGFLTHHGLRANIVEYQVEVPKFIPP